MSNKLDTFEDLTLGGPSSATDTSTTRSEIAATAGQRSNPTAQAILAQLQAALPKANGEATEILLNPEELGRVRMTLSGGDGVGSVLLQVERPETLDLIRRNIEQMRAELAEAGWDSVTFNFAQGGSDSSEGSSDRGQSGHTPGSAVPAETAQETPLPASRANASASGLDLRL
ncbi:flagellar hook-length control protein FliK [Dinoroseobacter sp. S375]|uniref:flagellar hook-length control protein FliK n=1 Tax=Dinoroseobacter sp. S375 TaxID=3415136 RepID=UPI003C79B893